MTGLPKGGRIFFILVRMGVGVKANHSVSGVIACFWRDYSLGARGRDPTFQKSRLKSGDVPQRREERQVPRMIQDDVRRWPLRTRSRLL